MLDWTRDDLAAKSKVSAATLADFEAGKRSPYGRTLADIRAALEAAGAIFVPENGGGPGVRLRKGLAGVGSGPANVKARPNAKPASKPRQRPSTNHTKRR
jgi:transcriptional regulator with XRE-family HTH domain